MANEITPCKFSKEHTLITKGILIILMIVHHVLVTEFRTQYHVKTLITNETLLTNIVSFGGICVSGFAFLSGYGMTQSLKSKKDLQWNSCFKWLCVRLIKLESSVFFIYILAILYKRFVIVESINVLYDIHSIGGKILFMLIDSLGMARYFSTPQINITWWYLYFAVLLIITMPFLYMLYKKFRYLLLPMLCLLPMAITSLNGEHSYYAILLPSAMLGVAFSYEEWFEKIKSKKNKAIKILFAIIIVKIAFDIWSNVGIEHAYTFAFIIPFIVFEFIAEIPILNTILKQIGKHATNIFLTHTFIYYYWYTDFIYSFHYSWCIIIVMLIISIILSMMLELSKKVSGYNRLITKIIDKLA